MRLRRSSDFWFGAAFLVFSGFLFSLTFGLSRSVVSNSIESEFFPRVLLAGIAFLGIILILRDIRHGNAQKTAGAVHVRPVVLFGALGIFLMAIPYIGYYAATALLIPCSLTLFGERRLIIHVLVVGIFLVVSYGLFDHSLGVLFPSGSFWEH